MPHVLFSVWKVKKAQNKASGTRIWMENVLQTAVKFACLLRCSSAVPLSNQTGIRDTRF